MYDPPFEAVSKEQIIRLKGPSLKCVDETSHEMLRDIKKCGNQVEQELKQFPMLHQEIVLVVTKLIQERVKIAKEKIDDLFDVELAYVNKKNPYFSQKVDLTPDVLNKKTAKRALNDEEKKRRGALEILIRDFFDIGRKRIQDLVPKLIMHWLVNYVRYNVRKSLTDNIQIWGDLLKEDDKIQRARTETNEKLQVSCQRILFFQMVKTKHFLGSRTCQPNHQRNICRP